MSREQENRKGLGVGSVVAAAPKLLANKYVLLAIPILFLVLVLPMCSSILTDNSSPPFTQEQMSIIQAAAEYETVDVIDLMAYYFFAYQGEDITETNMRSIARDFYFYEVDLLDKKDENGDTVLDEDGNAVKEEVSVTRRRSLEYTIRAHFPGYSDEDVQGILELANAWRIRLTQSVALPDGYVLPEGAFIWPAPSAATVTSVFGPRWGGQHLGVDLAGGNPENTAVIASASGKVIEVNTNTSHACGMFVRIDHENSYQSRYCHLNAVSVSRSQQVNQGDILGLLGDTGRSTAPHLHYEMKYNGTNVDPLPYIVSSQPGR